MQNGRFNEPRGFNYSFLCLKDRTQNNPCIQFEEVTLKSVLFYTRLKKNLAMLLFGYFFRTFSLSGFFSRSFDSFESKL